MAKSRNIMRKRTTARIVGRLFRVRKTLGLATLLCTIVTFVMYHNCVDVMVLRQLRSLSEIHRNYREVGEDLTTQGPHTEVNLVDMNYLVEQIRRRKVLNEACKNLNLSRSLPDIMDKKAKKLISHLIVDDKYKFMFNFIPKVSCSTWKHVMSKLYKSHSKGKRRPLTNYSTEEIGYRLKNYRKVLFVREPVVRLLSAYLNKFCNFEKMQRIWESAYGRSIVQKYRKYPHIYLNKWSKNSTSPDTFLNITFPEFIRFITDREDEITVNPFTDHFLPQHKVANPCAIRYDFIGHFENLSFEAPFMLKLFGLDHVTEFPEYHASKAVQALIDEYEKVPLGLLKRLQNYYRNDYKLFGYSFDGTFKHIIEGSFGDGEGEYE